jgi:class 3 adenylate cyclase
MDDVDTPTAAPAEFAHVIPFPIGRSGTRSGRRPDAPGSATLHPSMGGERRTTVLEASLVGWELVAQHLGPDAARHAVERLVEQALDAVFQDDPDAVDLDGPPERPLLCTTYEGGGHAHRALDAALRLRDEVAGSQPEGVLGEVFRVSVGVHTGSVVDLAVGGTEPVPFRAVGTLYGLTARLRESADPGQILLSADTLGHVTDVASVHAHDDVQLNRYGESREAFCLLGLRPLERA